MDATRFPPVPALPAHVTLDRRLVVGSTTYRIAATDTGDDRIDLTVIGLTPAGQVVSEISGGISPADLTGMAEVLASTLAGLETLRADHRVSPVSGKPRKPNHGVRWTPEADDRLLALHRDGMSEKELMEEFGRSRNGIRARLQHLTEPAPAS